MNLWQFAIRSFRYYRSTNLAIVLGVAAATAVLTGALIVGDSMRTSLHQLTLDRLGQIDEMLVSDGFFSADLANQLRSQTTFEQHYDQVTPLILFPGGTVEFRRPKTVRRSGQVSVLGITDAFWQLGTSGLTPRSLPVEGAIINQALADDLGLTDAMVAEQTAKITVRVPKQTQMPADSALGRKTDLIESLVDLTVVQIIPTTGLGRFGLFPSQADPMNVFIPIGLLQDSLARSVLSHKSNPNQVNTLLLTGKGNTPPTAEISQQLRNQLRPTLEDYGWSLKQVVQEFGEGNSRDVVFEYWSLSSDKMLLTTEGTTIIDRAVPDAKPVFTYLANDIRPVTSKSGIPFSMIAGIDFGNDFPLTSAANDQPLPPLKDDEIVLNQWAANDLDVQVGDRIAVTFFEPETTHGSQVDRTVEFRLAGIAKLTAPDSPFVARRRREVEPAVFVNRPTLANDPDLTPEVPGVTDAESIQAWDLPFETASKLRSQDDDYWEYYRTTPKAFINLATARRMWHSRFGETTSFRIPFQAGTESKLTKKLLDQIGTDQAQLGIHLVPIKRRGLAASSGSTPFDVLFLALSMFVIGSALILVSLLFRLGLQQRASELGLCKAIGFGESRLRRVWLIEMTLVSLLGAVLGLALGIGYAALMIQGLTTWWVGAISRPFLTMHVSGLSLILGLISGLIICIGTIAISIRRTGRQPITRLLRGQLESPSAARTRRAGSRIVWMIGGLIVAAIVLAVAAAWLSGEAQAGAFMGAGFLMLTAGLMLVYRWLRMPGSASTASVLSLSRLALLSAKRNPLRSTLTVGLVAVASFLIAAVSAFRLAPSDQGTAGFDWVAQSSQPIFEDLGTPDGQQKALGQGFSLPPGTEVLSLRYKSGEDASCNNLYQSTQPRVLGVPSRFVEHFNSKTQTAFAWASSLADSAQQAANPWTLLSDKSHAGTADDPIPVVLDKNTANYSLKIYSLGAVREVHYDTGETFHFKVVGMLANTILQGSLIMSEQDFETAFPQVAGYQYFLIKDPKGGDRLASGPGAADLSGSVGVSDGSEGDVSMNVDVLEDRLGDQGFDARSARMMLTNFMSVQNTYLSTFQTLGALGLLLGTFGLAAVQIRSVLERKRELGLMRAVGFELPKLSRMVMLENGWLLMSGLLVGIGSALFTTIPHWLVGSASVPWLALGAIFAGIAVVGLIAGWLASRNISRMPLLESLRGS